MIEILNTHKPILVGGLGPIRYGKQYSLGDRVYDSRAIAMGLCSSPVGDAGGQSYLYLIKEENIWGDTELENSRPESVGG